MNKTFGFNGFEIHFDTWTEQRIACAIEIESVLASATSKTMPQISWIVQQYQITNIAIVYLKLNLFAEAIAYEQMLSNMYMHPINGQMFMFNHFYTFEMRKEIKAKYNFIFLNDA